MPHSEYMARNVDGMPREVALMSLGIPPASVCSPPASWSCSAPPPLSAPASIRAARPE